MSRNSNRTLSLVCFGLLSIAATSVAHAEFKCDGRPLARVDATACAKAAESASALRWHVQRTQKIYGLQMSDYVRFEGDEPQSRSAQAKQAKAQNSMAHVAPPPR